MKKRAMLMAEVWIVLFWIWLISLVSFSKIEYSSVNSKVSQTKIDLWSIERAFWVYMSDYSLNPAWMLIKPTNKKIINYKWQDIDWDEIEWEFIFQTVLDDNYLSDLNKFWFDYFSEFPKDFNSTKENPIYYIISIDAYNSKYYSIWWIISNDRENYNAYVLWNVANRHDDYSHYDYTKEIYFEWWKIELKGSLIYRWDYENWEYKLYDWEKLVNWDITISDFTTNNVTNWWDILPYTIN